MRLLISRKRLTDTIVARACFQSPMVPYGFFNNFRDNNQQQATSTSNEARMNG